MSADTSAKANPQAQQTEKAPDYTLSEVALPALARHAPDLGPAELQALIQLTNLQLHNPDGVKIPTRALAKLSKISKSNLIPAIEHLITLNLLTVRRGDTRNPSTYRVTILDTIQISGPISGPLNPEQWSQNRTTADLFQDQSGPDSGPPPPDSKGLATAAASLDLDVATLRLIDRVLSGKIKDHDKDDVVHFRHRLAGYYAKFGRDDLGKPLRQPHPPGDDLIGQFLALDSPRRLETMLDALEIDALTNRAHDPSTNGTFNPYNYAWFVTIGLSRVHKIHFSVTKKARAALRDVKRRPAPPQPEQQTLIDIPDVADLARKKAMP